MIRKLREKDAEAYFKLRREALLDSPLAFASSPEDDRAATVEVAREQLRLDVPDQVIFGAFDDRHDEDRIVGMAGLFRDRHLKAAHKVHVWGMYVVPSHRRRGIAAELLQAALRHARSLPGVAWVHLTASSSASGARRLYQRAGFELWGTEPDALRHDGRSVDDHHLALRVE